MIQRVAEDAQSELDDGLPPVSLWERMSFEATRTCIRFLVRVASLEGLYRIGEAFATLEWLINYKRRRRFAVQIKERFGSELTPAELRRASLRHFVRMRNDKLFYLLCDHLPSERLKERLRIVNREIIDEALSKGHGVYLAVSHFGAHHVGMHLLCQYDYRVAGVRDPKEGASRRFIRHKHEAKERKRVRHHHNDAYPRELFRWLAGNGLLTSAMDAVRVHDERRRTAEVTLFGQKRRLLTGPMQLAARCGSPVLHVFVISRRNFHYTLDVHGPLVDPTKGEVTEAMIDAAMQEYADRTEQYIRAYPCHISRI